MSKKYKKKVEIRQTTGRTGQHWWAHRSLTQGGGDLTVKKHWWSCTVTKGNEGGIVHSKRVLQLAEDSWFQELLFSHCLAILLKLSHASGRKKKRKKTHTTVT